MNIAKLLFWLVFKEQNFSHRSPVTLCSASNTEAKIEITDILEMFVSVSDIRGQVIVANKHVYSWLIFQTLVWTYSQVRGVNTILLQCTFVTKVLMSESFSEMSYCGVKHCKNSVVYRTRIVRMAHVPILRFHCPPRSRFVCLNAPNESN